MKKIYVAAMVCGSLLLAGCAGSSSKDKDSDNGNGRVKTNVPGYSDRSNEYSEPNYSSNYNVAKAKPSDNQMVYDLIGHTISEGTTQGYHHEGWNYTIENGSVSDFNVTDVLAEDDSQLIVVADMNLRGTSSPHCNFYYHATVQIRYVNLPGDGWTLDYVHCLGMEVVSDGQYDDMVSARIADDGWGGVNCLQVQNLSECRLIVGGYFYADGTWQKFSLPVDAYEQGAVGGTFGGGSVESYQLDFVVRES